MDRVEKARKIIRNIVNADLKFLHEDIVLAITCSSAPSSLGKICTVKEAREALSLLDEPVCKTCGGFKMIPNPEAEQENPVIETSHGSIPTHHSFGYIPSKPDWIPCPDCQQPPAGIETNFFSCKARQSFRDRAKKLKAKIKWPNTNWYNDEDFYKVYEQACDRLNKRGEAMDYLLTALALCSPEIEKHKKHIKRILGDEDFKGILK